MSKIRPTVAAVVGAIVIVGSAGTTLAAPPDLRSMTTEPALISVERVTDDGTGRSLDFTSADCCDELQDMLVADDGSVILATVRGFRRAPRDGRRDAIRLDVWRLGEPGQATVWVPTASSGIAEGPDGTIWVAGEGRFLAEVAESEPRVTVEQGQVQEYYDHVVDHDGTVWAIYVDGLWRYGGRRWTRVGDTGLPWSPDEAMLAVDGDGTLWAIVDRRNLASYDGEAWRRIELPVDGDDVALRALGVGRDGRLYVSLASVTDGRCGVTWGRLDADGWFVDRDTLLGTRRAPLGEREAVGARGALACPAPEMIGADAAGRVWLAMGNIIASIEAGPTSAIVLPGASPAALAVGDDGRAWLAAPSDWQRDSDLYVLETVE